MTSLKDHVNDINLCGEVFRVWMPSFKLRASIMCQSIPKAPIPQGIPGHLTEVCIWLSCSKHWSAFQQNGFHNSFHIQHAHRVHRQMLLYSLFCWSVWEPLKSPLNVGFLEWTIKLKWTNLRKTRYFGCILSAAQPFLVSSRNAPPWVVFSRIIIFD